jgi:hypothetical protein
MCDVTNDVSVRKLTEGSTVLRVHKLSDEKRRSSVGNGDTKSKEKASGDEHLEVDRDRLKDHTKDHDQTSDHDAPSSSQAVCDVGNHGQSDKRTDGHDTCQKTEQGAGWVSEV